MVIFWVAIIVFLTHALEAVTGFGCTVLAFPFVALLLSLEEAKVLLTVIAWLLATYLAITKYKKINFREFFKIIALAALGMPIGISFFNHAPKDLLKASLAIFIIIASIIQLTKIYRPSSSPVAKRRFYHYLFLILGGIFHGAFASGGPFIVLYAAKSLRDKGEFRATLTLLWSSLNTILFITDDTFTPLFLSIHQAITASEPISTEVKHLLLMGPPLLLGIIAGEIIHHRVNENAFKAAVFWVLLMTGLFMLGSSAILIG